MDTSGSGTSHFKGGKGPERETETAEMVSCDLAEMDGWVGLTAGIRTSDDDSTRSLSLETVLVQSTRGFETMIA